MSSTYFEPNGSSSRRRLYMQVWYSVFRMHRCRQSCSLLKLMHVKHTKPCMYTQPSS